MENQVIALIIKSAQQKGAKFVAVNSYKTKEGEISNYVINTNVNFDGLKQADIEHLQSLSYEGIAEEARVALLESLEANRNDETRSNQSQAQLDAYTYITPAIKVHNETKNLYVVGQRVKKTVLVAGTYKEVKSRPLTIEKNKIKKNLKTEKYRNFLVGNMAEIKMQGSKFVFDNGTEFELSESEPA